MLSIHNDKSVYDSTYPTDYVGIANLAAEDNLEVLKWWIPQIPVEDFQGEQLEENVIEWMCVALDHSRLDIATFLKMYDPHNKFDYQFVYDDAEEHGDEYDSDSLDWILTNLPPYEMPIYPDELE
jgi:glutaredoxin-related protein